MKEDILEQLAEDWLQASGYFTRTNLKFRPSRSHADYAVKIDSVHSDIDLVGVNPIRSGADRVVVVSCKSWQGGVDVARMHRALIKNGGSERVGAKPAWKHFRELIRPKWSEAFVTAIKEATGSERFKYVMAITCGRNMGHKRKWEEESIFRNALNGNPMEIVTRSDMLGKISTGLGTTVAASQFSRTIQLIKAAGMTVELRRVG